jgi:hypothetical protein
MKMATAYKRSDGWYFHAVSKTTVGVGLSWPPYIKLDIHATKDALGSAALGALDGTEFGVPHPKPTEADEGFRPMLELAGVKSWAAFARHATNVHLHLDDKWLMIEPWKNAGVRDGFVPIEGVSLRLPLGSAAAKIGEALGKAMEIAQSASVA